MTTFDKILKLNRSTVGLAFGAAMLSIIANRSGVGWSWDTSDYVAVGKNFAKSATLLDATGLPMTVRPPGLSFLIAIGDLIGLSINFTIQILNSLCAMTLVLGTNYLLRSTKISNKTVLLATAFVAFSPALLWQYSMIWSEPPFIALVVIAMIVSMRGMTTRKFFLLTTLFVALFFVRYVGPVFAAAIAISSTWFNRRQMGLLKSAVSNFAIYVLSLVPVWFWLQRNESIDGTLTGARTPAGGSLLSPLRTFVATIGSWLTASPVEGSIYLSYNDYPNVTKTLGLLLVIGLVGLLLLRLFESYRDKRSSDFCDALVLSLSISVIYTLFSAYRFVHFELGPLDNRMMIPIYVPLVIAVAILLDGIKIKAKRLRLASTTFFALFVAFQAISSIDDALQFGKNGRYWAAGAFQEQPLHRFINDLPDKTLLMSNQPQQLYSVWQKTSVFNQYQLELAQSAECDSRLFVWYNSTYDDGTPNVEGQPENASQVFSDQSGTIFDLKNCASDITYYWP